LNTVAQLAPLMMSLDLCQAGHECTQESSKIVSLGAPSFSPFLFWDFQINPYA
jgi:hypothetical protein